MRIHICALVMSIYFWRIKERFIAKRHKLRIGKQANPSNSGIAGNNSKFLSSRPHGQKGIGKGFLPMAGFPPRFFPGIPFVTALFDLYPMGTPLLVGMDSGLWRGAFGGIQDGVALLTNALLFSNIGTPIDGARPVVRIPLRQITFVSQ